MEIKKFLQGSETFNGFEFKGNFIMPTQVFLKCYNHFLQTNENVLDDYANIVYLGWEGSDDYNVIFTELELINLEKNLNKLHQLGIISEVKYNDLYCILTKFIDKHEEKQKRLNEYSCKRNIANKFIQKSDVKSAIFQKYGERCLCCGSSENIVLDHVIPIYNNGKNEIDNLQPLCQMCNSRKGSKIIDYRGGL